MGSEIGQRYFTREQRQAYRHKVLACLDVLEEMLHAGAFTQDAHRTGLEIELNLVDDDHQPSFANAEVLEAIANPEFQTELARFNIEFNVPRVTSPGMSCCGWRTRCGRPSTRRSGAARNSGTAS